jgi:putative FmdB family regulatory protein
MPIFEYRCLKCESEFEKLVFGASSGNGIQCPDCQAQEVEQLFSSFNGVSRSSDGSTKPMASSGCSSCHASSCSSCGGH